MDRTGKTIATIQARTGSSRLPGKVMRPILGRPMLELMIERVKMARSLDEIVIATSVNKNDDVLEGLAGRMGVGCFRGSETDVLSRVAQAVARHSARHVVQLWGDTPLIDPGIIDDAVAFYRGGNHDCVATFLDKTFPWGMSLLVFPAEVLAYVDSITSDPVDREHVSNYIYEHPDMYKVGHLPCPADLKRPDIRLTVDEIDDFNLVSKVFEHFLPSNPAFTTGDIIAFLDRDPGLLEINRRVRQKKIRQAA